MTNAAQVDEFASEVMEDFKATSGYASSSHFLPLPISIDFDAILAVVVRAVVERVVDWAGRRLDARKGKAAASLSEEDIREIRELVLGFAENTRRSGGDQGLSPEFAARMADSVERVVRQNPHVLLANRPGNR